MLDYECIDPHLYFKDLNKKKIKNYKNLTTLLMSIHHGNLKILKNSLKILYSIRCGNLMNIHYLKITQIKFYNFYL